MIINPYIFGQVPPLLDLYPNAAVAYSVRKLRTAYTGNCIRVRRSSDNAEQNIGFVNNELDTVSLLSFVGAGNGFVTTWYDQSVNANNSIQSTAVNQMKIVDNGNLYLINGKASIKGENNVFLNTGVSINTIPNSMFTVISANNISQNNLSISLFIAAASNAQEAILVNTNINKLYRSGTVNYINGLSHNANQQYIVSTITDTSTSRLLAVNNINVYTGNISVNNFLANTFSINRIRSRLDLDPQYGLDCNYQTVVLYGLDQSANRTNIENILNSYFNTYP